MFRTQRPTISQEWSVIPLTVGTTPQQVAASLGPSSLVSTVVFSVPTGAANSVFLGPNAGVTITTGIEIPAGVPQQYRTINERELVEVESPLLDMLVALSCRRASSDVVPIITWDLQNMYLVATANTVCNVGIFKEMWV